MLKYMVLGGLVTALSWALRYEELAQTAAAVRKYRVAAGMSKQAALAWAILVDTAVVAFLWPLQGVKLLKLGLDWITGVEDP